MVYFPLDKSDSVIVNCAAVKKKNIEISSSYYTSMESYISTKNSAYLAFSTAMNKITPSTFDNGETQTTKALEAAVYSAKLAYDNIPAPPTPLKLNNSCCTSDNTLYNLTTQSCITPTMIGPYQMSDNVYSNKLSYINSSTPNIEGCKLACSVDKECFQALYNKSTKICYLMGKDDPSKSYTYTYSKDYSLLTAPPPPDSPPTNIPIPPSFNQSDIFQGDPSQIESSNSSSIIIIVAVSITMLFVLLFMIYMFFLRKQS